MKKLFIALLVSLMLVALCACGSPAETAAPAAPVQESAQTAAPAPAEPAAPAENPVTVVETGANITVIKASDWAEKYPEIYASYMRTAEDSETTDYVEDYSMIGKLYEGMAFNTYYESARGHAYTVTDIVKTGRPHKLANCFTCKTPDFTVMANNMGDAAYSIPADEDFIQTMSEPVSCYNCHANEPGKLVVTHTYLSDAMGKDLQSVDPANLSCGQCHVEYYFDPATKATVLPYTDLSTMTPDAILDFFNNRLIVDGQSFADYTNPKTGVRQIKVQHPEFETFLGEGSIHKGDFTCADCHMGDAVSESGVTYKNHFLSSPLKNQDLIQNTCSECHTDLVSEVRAIQETMERRTYAIGYLLESLTDKLVVAVESGEYTEEELNTIRSLARNAQFYWDFVFVENSEGAHNSALDHQCLDKAEAIANQALGLFKPATPAAEAPAAPAAPAATEAPVAEAPAATEAPVAEPEAEAPAEPESTEAPAESAAS